MNKSLYQRLLGGLVLLGLAFLLWRIILPESMDVLIDRQTRIPAPPHFERYKVAQPYKPSIEPVDQLVISDTRDVAAMNTDAEFMLDEGGLPITWVVQVASFHLATNANELVHALQAKNYAAYSRTVKRHEGDLIRVYVGPMISKRLAEKDKQAIDEAFDLRSIVVRFEQ